MRGKALKKVRGDIPDREKVKKYQLGINDFEQAAEIRLTLPVHEERIEKVLLPWPINIHVPQNRTS